MFLDSGYFRFSFVLIFLFFRINTIVCWGQTFTIGDSQYYIDVEQKYNWAESLANCLERDMTLVSIENWQKSSEINRYVKNNFGKQHLWVGGILSRNGGNHHIWLSTGKRFDYTYWSNNNPDFFFGNEYCVQIGWGSDMEWNDRSCNDQLGFICESKKQYQQLEQQNKELKNQLQQEKQKQMNLHKEFQQQKEQLENLHLKMKNIERNLTKENKDQRAKYESEQKELIEKHRKEVENLMKSHENLQKDFNLLKQQKDNFLKQQDLQEKIEELLQQLKEREKMEKSLEKKPKFRDFILKFEQK